MEVNHETAEQPNNETDEQAELQEEDDSKKEEEELVAKVNKLTDKITASAHNPEPTVLHALASILETHESRYMEENGQFPSINGRSVHNIGRLGSIIRENDELFELISSKFLSETGYSTSVQVASARLLLCCSLTWTYPHVFEEPVIENIKDWVMCDSARVSAEDQSLKHHPRKREASDSEMLKTYSTGLLAVCLIGGGKVAKDVLTSGLSAKLMRYLRLRVLGETSSTQKDIGHSTESRHSSGNSPLGVRDDGCSRFRILLEASPLDDTRMIDERSSEDQILEWGPDRNIGEQNFLDNSWVGGEPPDGLGEDADICDVDAGGEDRWHGRDTRDGRIKYGEHDDNVNDSSRLRGKRERSRGKARVDESTVESEPVLSSPGSGSRLGQGRSGLDRSIPRNADATRVPDSKKTHARATTEASLLEREDNDDCFQECRIGSKDISDLVRKAVRAAEAEATSANAPEEAVNAAGDAAADPVKTAASEEFKSNNDEEAVVFAASRAAATVIDAASAVKVSRSSIGIDTGTENVSCRETDSGEDLEDYFMPDTQSLAKLREKYCIQCLELLGEYVKVLGPVLHEKGVDVCLALLQQNSKHKEASKDALLLPDVMKLICALAAHREFAAPFVDRGGIQKLLAVPRTTQTFVGLSSSLFTISSLQGIMEQVCALPSDVVYHVVELALQLLDCNQDQARKNAALFFAAAFVFRAVLDAFDSQDGLQKLVKLLGLLKDAALVRSGVDSGALGLSNTGSLRNDRSSAEVLTLSEKQIAYHTCVALRQYFRAHLLLLVDSIRPNKNNPSAARNIPSVRSVYKPLDISNEAVDAVFLQLQNDQKLGLAFVRTPWQPVEKFLKLKGHITMLELCQAPPGERYLHDLPRYAMGVLQIVTLVPSSHKMIVDANLSNNRDGVAVILDAANIVSGHVKLVIIEPALNVLVNLVCPPPSISNKPTVVTQGQQFPSAQITNSPSETRDRTAQSSEIDPRERNGETSAVDRGSASVRSTQNVNNTPQTPAGLVRSNNGIKVLRHILQVQCSPALDCVRALACRVLRGLARDDIIAHTMTRLEIEEELSRLARDRDSGSQTTGTEQRRWQAELSRALNEVTEVEEELSRLARYRDYGSQTTGTEQRRWQAELSRAPNELTEIEEVLSRLARDRDSGSQTTGTGQRRWQDELSQAPNELTEIEEELSRLPRDRDSGSQTTGTEQRRWQSELSQAPNELTEVEEELSELSRDSGSHTRGTEHGSWQAELSLAPNELTDALSGPANVMAWVRTRYAMYGGSRGDRRDRQLLYSRFLLGRTCRDDAGDLLTCITFVGDSYHIAVGSHNGELKIFDSENSHLVESFAGHQNPLTLVQSFVSGDNQLLLSSSSQDVKLWDATSISSGPTHSFEGCKAARFSKDANVFAALPSESARREILLYDIQTCQLETKLSDTLETSSTRSDVYSSIHFSPFNSSFNSMLMWNGVLWDRRVSEPVYRFEQLTDYGGGGFHPASNVVIINSEVLDLRKFRLLRSVPSLDQTSITFNAHGNVMYATLRSNLEDVMSAVHGTSRGKHPLYAAFRTLDAMYYSDIATIPVGRCILDFASEPKNSVVGLVALDDQDEKYASARIYDIGVTDYSDSDTDDSE